MQKVLSLMASVFYYLLYCLARFTASDINIHLKSHGFSELDLASLNFLFSFSYALLQIPIGFAQDIFSQRVVSSLLIFLSLLGNLCFFFSKNFFILCLGKLLTGVGASMAAVGLWSFLLKNMPQDFLVVSSLSTAVGLLLPIYLPNIIGKNIAIEKIFLFQFFFGSLVLFLMLFFGDRNKENQNTKNQSFVTPLVCFFSSIISTVAWFLVLGSRGFDRNSIAIQCFCIFMSVLFFTNMFFNSKSKIVQDLKTDLGELKKPIPLLIILNVCLIVSGFYAASEGKIDFYMKSAQIAPSVFLKTAHINLVSFFSSFWGNLFFFGGSLGSVLGFFITKKIEYLFLLFCLLMGTKILSLPPGADIVKLSYSYSGFLMPLIVRTMKGFRSILFFSFINALLPFWCYFFIPNNYFLVWCYCFLLGVICKMQVVTADNWRTLFPEKQNYNGIFSILNSLITTVGAGFFPWFITFIMEIFYGKNAIDHHLHSKNYFFLNGILGFISFVAILLVIFLSRKRKLNQN